MNTLLARFLISRHIKKPFIRKRDEWLNPRYHPCYLKKRSPHPVNARKRYCLLETHRFVQQRLERPFHSSCRLFAPTTNSLKCSNECTLLSHRFFHVYFLDCFYYKKTIPRNQGGRFLLYFHLECLIDNYLNRV